MERGRDGEAMASVLDMSERGRRDVGFRGCGKPLSVLRGEGEDDSDDGRGRAKTPSSTNVGDGDAMRLGSRLRSRTGLGAFASVARGTPDLASLE